MATYDHASLLIHQSDSSSGGSGSADVAAALALAMGTGTSYSDRLHDQWNIAGIKSNDGYPSITSHYGYHMVCWHLLFALSGQDANLSPSLPSSSSSPSPSSVSSLAGAGEDEGALNTNSIGSSSSSSSSSSRRRGSSDGGASLTFAPKMPCPYTLPVLLPNIAGTLSCKKGSGGGSCHGTNSLSLGLTVGKLALPSKGLVVSGSAYAGAVDLTAGQEVSWCA